MLKKTIEYTDFNDVTRKEDFYFHFSKAELMEMELSTTGGLQAMIQKIMSTQDIPAIVKVFKDLILKAYGEKSADGKAFIKMKTGINCAISSLRQKHILSFSWN
mgnify:CR=1 FL=1